MALILIAIILNIAFTVQKTNSTIDNIDVKYVQIIHKMAVYHVSQDFHSIKMEFVIKCALISIVQVAQT